MDPNRLTLTQGEFNAHMLQGVMGATAQPGETEREGQTRCAAIVELFRAFDAANPIEAMMACHCISLRFLFEAAMHDANAADLEPVMLIRMRASAMAIGKSLDLWMRNFASQRARNEARAAEAQHPGQPAQEATATKAQPAAKQARPLQAESPRPVAEPPVAPPPLVATMAGRGQSVPGLADLPCQSMKQALLSSATVSAGVAGNATMLAAGS